MKLTHFAMGALFLLLTAAIYLTMQSDMDGRIEEMKADYERRLDAIENARKTQPAPPVAVPGVADAVKAPPGKATEASKVGASNVAVAANETAVDPAVREALKNVRSKVAASPDEPPANDIADAGNPGATAADLPAKLLEKEHNILDSTGIGVERIAEDTAAVIGAAPAGEKLTTVQSLVAAQPRIARIKNADEANKSGFVVLDRGLDANLAKGDSFAIRRGTAIIGRVVIGDTIHETECVADVVIDKLVTGMSLKTGDEVIKFDR
jgi:hypothetical protein